MTPLYSYQNDTEQVSCYKMAYNFYILAVAAGYVGTFPRPSDTEAVLLSLTVDYTAYLA